jgi:gamma-glutamylcyclotransferase (GGCT)/AIG2-like uncharacterized protein YtfP
MTNRCPNHRFIGKGILKGYRWIISKRGYANIIKSETDEVHGVVYEITASDEQSLDRHEGVNSGSYKKKMMIVEVDGQNKKCLVYVDPLKQEGKPKQEYIKRINKGISDSKLPPEYVKRYIRNFIPAQ